MQDLLENVQEQEQGMEKIKTALEEGDEEAKSLSLSKEPNSYPQFLAE